MNDKNENDLRELRKLVYDYSFMERRNFKNLDRMNNLMTRALREVVKKGLIIADVEKLIGPPSVRIGVEGDDEIIWLYPCLPDKNGINSFGWYWQLKFRHQALDSFEKVKWLLDR